jgi:hypothetical protein
MRDSFYSLILVAQAWIRPICLVSAWLLVGLVIWSVAAVLYEGVRNAQRMHKIPCSSCSYFENNYHLRCAVNPSAVLSESAINCLDYCPKQITTPIS